MEYLKEDSPEDRNKMLRAIGINPVAPRSNSSLLPLDLTEMRRLIDAGLKVDGVRDRHGSTALGVAAHLGRVEAMKLLIEAGASLDAANLDDATPLHLAVFGKAANAVAMLLVYGGESIETADALADAHGTGARDIVAVFDAWENDEEHDLIEQAEEYHSESLPILEKLKQQSGADRESVAGSASGGALAEALARAEAAENDLKDAKESAAKWEERALKAEAALEAAQQHEKKHHHHGLWGHFGERRGSAVARGTPRHHAKDEHEVQEHGAHEKHHHHHGFWLRRGSMTRHAKDDNARHTMLHTRAPSPTGLDRGRRSSVTVVHELAAKIHVPWLEARRRRHQAEAKVET